MRTAIYGCGAMGTVLGAFLNRGGARVDLIDSYAEHVKALNEKGAALVGFENFTQPVHALLPEQMQGVYDLVILMTKQTANQAAFTKIAPHVGAGSAVLTLQNGVPEPGVSACFGEDRTLGGTIEWGATFRGPGVSEVTQPLTGDYVYFNIGTVSGVENDRVRAAAGLLREGRAGTARYYVSDTTESFAQLSDWFLGEYAGGPVTRISVDGYPVEQGAST